MFLSPDRGSVRRRLASRGRELQRNRESRPPSNKTAKEPWNALEDLGPDRRIQEELHGKSTIKGKNPPVDVLTDLLKGGASNPEVRPLPGSRRHDKRWPEAGKEKGSKYKH